MIYSTYSLSSSNLSPKLEQAFKYVQRNKACNKVLYDKKDDISLAYLILSAGGTEDSAISAVLYKSKEYLLGDDISLLFGDYVVELMINLLTFEEESSLILNTLNEVSLIACAIYLHDLRTYTLNPKDWDIDKEKFYSERIFLLEDLPIPSNWINEMNLLMNQLKNETKCYV